MTYVMCGQNKGEQMLFDYQVKDDRGWRTVAANLDQADVDVQRDRCTAIGRIEGTHYRFSRSG